MSETTKAINRWTLKEVDEAAAAQLQQELRIHPVLCRLLVQRGVTSLEEAKLFFRHSLDDLHDPFLMQDMDKAVERIEKAIANQEHILIYGDYDVDGTTSVALVYTFLREFYVQIDYYIPDRYAEGYGISFAGIDYAEAHGCSLIIALDCGIKAIEKVDYANNKHIDFIICDHHLPGDTIPKALAVLDPKRPDCQYPYKELSGCGIGFKLMQAFAEHNDIPFEVLAKQLDLVAVSIAADIVPMTGENRILAHYGLERINTAPRAGLKKLITGAGLADDKILDISNLVFTVAPRINAAGRMGHAKDAVKLLITESNEEAIGDAFHLNDQNAARKDEDKAITEEALQMILETPGAEDWKTTVLWQEHWHKGVIGIVASRLTEHYYRPTILLTESNGLLTGSARSVKGYSIYNALLECDDLIEQWGGHHFAAGLSILPENFEAFQKRFEEVVSSTIDVDLLTPEIVIDAELELQDINPKFYGILRQFGPFGPENMRPAFVTRQVHDTGQSRNVGEDRTHLKLSITKKGAYADGIAFGMGHWLAEIRQKPFDVCYSLEENHWNGRTTIQLQVKDIKIPD